MARRKKQPTKAMKELEQRIAGMKASDPAMDAGNGVSVAAGEALLTEARTLLENYNIKLAEGDDLLNQFTAKNREAGKFNSKVLPAVGLKYGKDSSEYEMAGGKRESERKKPVRKQKTPTT